MIWRHLITKTITTIIRLAAPTTNNDNHSNGSNRMVLAKAPPTHLYNTSISSTTFTLSLHNNPLKWFPCHLAVVCFRFEKCICTPSVQRYSAFGEWCTLRRIPSGIRTDVKIVVSYAITSKMNKSFFFWQMY